VTGIDQGYSPATDCPGCSWSFAVNFSDPASSGDACATLTADVDAIADSMQTMADADYDFYLAYSTYWVVRNYGEDWVVGPAVATSISLLDTWMMLFYNYYPWGAYDVSVDEDEVRFSNYSAIYAYTPDTGAR
jgi:hypothetical protein